jgi:hypothetical protein
MANQITELIPGQAPSLMQAEKGNELIRSINALKRSRGVAGINVTIDGDGELVISQTVPQIENHFVFRFANGNTWEVPAQSIFPARGKIFWAINFYVGSNGQVQSHYANNPDFPVTLYDFQDSNLLFEREDALHDSTVEGGQNYTRVPIIAYGKYINTGGIWQENTVCQDGVAHQQFYKL